MADLTRAIERFRSAYDALFVVVDHYPDTLYERGGACGVWSPREVLAHLSGWIEEALDRYATPQDLEQTRFKPPSEQYDDDTFNAMVVKKRQHMTWTQTVTELRENMQKLSQHAELLSDDPNPTTNMEDFAGWLLALAKDCREHTEQLRAFSGSSA